MRTYLSIGEDRLRRHSTLCWTGICSLQDISHKYRRGGFHYPHLGHGGNRKGVRGRVVDVQAASAHITRVAYPALLLTHYDPQVLVRFVLGTGGLVGVLQLHRVQKAQVVVAYLRIVAAAAAAAAVHRVGGPSCTVCILTTDVENPVEGRRWRWIASPNSCVFEKMAVRVFCCFLVHDLALPADGISLVSSAYRSKETVSSVLET